MTTFWQAVLLVTMPLRIVGMLAVECGKSLAVLVGTGMIGPDGRFRWRG